MWRRHELHASRLRVSSIVAGLALAAMAAACVGPPLAGGTNGSGGTKGSGGTNGSGGTKGTGGSGGKAVQGSGGQGVAAGLSRRVRRLSNHEYDNVVRDLLGDTTRPSHQFDISDASPNGYDNGSDGLAVQSDQVIDYQVAAESLASTAVADRLPAMLNGCDPTAAGEDACRDAFLAHLPPRAFRRPLTDSELDRLRKVYAEGASEGGLAQGVQLVIEVLLQSPQFLYREELGAPGAVPDSARRVALTPYEVASELSFLITGTMPDEDLFEAARSGRLQGPDDYRREAMRLLATPAATESTRRFLHQWLGTDRLEHVTKDQGVYPAFQADRARSLPTAAASMATELDRDFEALMTSGSGSLRELFTSNQSYVDARLAALYGVSAPTTGGFGPVALDASVRRGILTRLGYLTVHADQDSSGPIARGVFLMSNLVCLTVPLRPATVPSPPSAGHAVDSGQTTRQRFTEHLSNDVCRGCHKIIDGFGFGFESYDGIGVYRTTENGTPVDSAGTIIGAGDADGPFAGVVELEDRLLRSARLTDCFVRQTYRFAMGRIETAAPDEAAALAALAAGFSPDTRLSDPLLSLVVAPAFTWRTTAGGAP